MLSASCTVICINTLMLNRAYSEALSMRAVYSGRLRHALCMAQPVRYCTVAPTSAMMPWQPRAVSARSLWTTAPRFQIPEKKETQTSPVQTKEENKPKTIKERVQNMWSTVKYLFRFYWNGIKQVWRNREKVKQIQAAAKEAKRDLTWEETLVVRTHSSDMRKLPLFIFILMTIEELLPLMVIYTPFLLPSTCILPSQKAKIESQAEAKRQMALQKLAELVKPSVSCESEKSASQSEGLTALSAEALTELTRCVRKAYMQTLWAVRMGWRITAAWANYEAPAAPGGGRQAPGTVSCVL